MRTISLLVLGTALFCTVCYGNDQETQTPAPDKAVPLSDVAEAKVLKVYTTKDGDHKFIAYVVKWKDNEIKDNEIVVSDPLAKSNFKVGDTIRFMIMKWHSEKSKPEIFTLYFQLFEPPALKFPWQNPAPVLPQPQS